MDDAARGTRPQLRGVHIEPVHCPSLYTPAQIERAVTVMADLNRGRFVWTEPPPDRLEEE